MLPLVGSACDDALHADTYKGRQQLGLPTNKTLVLHAGKLHGAGKVGAACLSHCVASSCYMHSLLAVTCKLQEKSMADAGLWRAYEFVWRPAEDGVMPAAKQPGGSDRVKAAAPGTGTAGAVKASAPVNSGSGQPAPAKVSAAAAAQGAGLPDASRRGGGGAQLPAGAYPSDVKHAPRRRYLPSLQGFPGVGLYSMVAVVVGAVGFSTWHAISARYRRGYAPPHSTHTI